MAFQEKGKRNPIMGIDGFENILAIGAHPEDIEFGCAATLARFICDRREVHYMAFSMAKESVKEPWSDDIMEIQAREATERLGIKPGKVLLRDYKVRKLEYVRQDVLEELVSIREIIHPDLVFLPSIHDLHQDHATVSIEGIRAFRNITVLGYELPWNNISFDAEAFVAISEDHLKTKLYALDAYESQKYRNYLDADFIRSVARMRGVQMQAKYAEAFEVIRWILR